MCSKLNLTTGGITKIYVERVGIPNGCLRRGLTEVLDSRMSFVRPSTVMQIRSVLRNLLSVLETISHNMGSTFDAAL